MSNNQKRRNGAYGLLAAALLASSFGVTYAHVSDTEGHVPANVNYGFQPIGHDVLRGVADGLYTDVWSHKGFAYVGTFQDPACDRSGVFIVDIEASIANYASGQTQGAVVAEIKSQPNTRINDVKVHTIGDKDILITTQEPCGRNIPGWSQSDGQAPFQVGQGGISLYDVTDPSKPKSVKRNFLEFEGVHNTFPFDWQGKTYLLGTANTFDFFDTFVVDISKPQSPKLLKVTGAVDWIPQGLKLDQLETGSSAGVFNHDVWVDMVGGKPIGTVSYWDAGFVTLDLTDPANPVFLRDTTYVDPEPITGFPYEGNAHAAVLGGNGDYLFGGDEDFSPLTFALLYDSTSFPAATADFGPPSSTLAGNEVIWTGGVGCTAGDIPPATGPMQIALIQRGVCFFQDKADAAEAQGYVGYIVANDAARGDALTVMGARDTQPVGIPGVFIGYSSGEQIKANPGLNASTVEAFDGWGYLHVYNNTDSDITVPTLGMLDPSAFKTVAPGFELGYYAPAEAVEPNTTGQPLGDLTMHNLEVDPGTQDLVPGFNQGPRMFIAWYSLGMRAVEYRPGHYHANLNGEGSYSQNVHEVGRWIDPNGGSNFWGIHVDQRADGSQIIVASDRNSGLWIFTFSCETRTDTGSVFYCNPAAGGGTDG